MLKMRDECRQYLENLQNLSSDDELLDNVKSRTLLAATEIFGAKSAAMRFFDSILETGTSDLSRFSTELLTDGAGLIDEARAESVGKFFAFEMYMLHIKDSYYYRGEGLAGLWCELADAGLDHDQIARYHELFEPE